MYCSVELLFPLFELLALPKFKPKCVDDVNLNTSILKFLNAKSIMLMYIFYCGIGFLLYIFYSLILFEVINIDSETSSKFFGSDINNSKKISSLTYIIYFVRTIFYLIGLISSIIVRHVYKKSLEIYQGFS
ncbi:hypothetical protein BCR36DRAFT_410661 [Piromyces finnis]|uniref:Uncharacterized protein n=1 Tax=Piromyces finnis TaxID=1754191 RepID=A0A1Y1VGM3_9FUNG|nr:hypothetical protein BCR36DRAFT_410661 [Piromyces finnis]|eukprot:ORX54861.1 hypothetical protein BCR36DRAFT_410661 [Piromyces finnis]